MRNYKINLIVLSSIIAIFTLSDFAFSEAPSNKSKTKRPRYAPGELIVKFKSDKAVENLISQIAIHGRIKTLDITSSLKKLNKKYGLKRIRRVFKPFTKKDASGKTKILTPNEWREEIKKKFPQKKLEDIKIPDIDKVYILEFDKDADIEAIADEYRKNPDVEIAGPNLIAIPGGVTPNDTNFDDQWNLKGFPGIKANSAWDFFWRN
jgi:hypothetical protein